MAMYWDKERVAIEVIDDEKISNLDRYPKGTLVFYVGANQVAQEDLLDCLRHLLIERGLRVTADDASDPNEAESVSKVWAAELELAHNLMADDDELPDPLDRGAEENRDDNDDDNDDDIDLKLEEYMAGMGMLRGYPYIADDLAAKQVIIHDCGQVSIG